MGLPPTTTKGSADSTPVTTFEFDFPNNPVTHTGTRASLGTTAVAGGGTNITTYTTGDLLYCSAPNVLSKLPIGSTNNIIQVSGGLPVWQNIVGAGAAISDWQSYTPVTQGFGVISNVNMFYRRVGDSVEIIGSFTNGTNTAVQGRLGLPSPLTIDNSKNVGLQLTGQWSTASNSSIAYGNMIATGGDSFVGFGFRDASDASNAYQNPTSIMPNGTTVYIYGVMVPVAGWSANQSLSNNAFYSGSFQAGCTWDSSSATFVDPTSSGSSPVLTQRQANGLSVTAAAGNAPGITFTPATAQSVYMVTAITKVLSNVAGIAMNIQMTDGSTTIGTAQAQEGAVSTINGHSITAGPFIFVPGTASPVTVKLQTAGTGGNLVEIGNTAGPSTALEWSVVQIK